MARKFIYSEAVLDEFGNGRLPSNVISGFAEKEDFVKISPGDLKYIVDNWNTLSDAKLREYFYGQGFGAEGLRYESGIETEVSQIALQTGGLEVSDDLLTAYLLGVKKFKEGESPTLNRIFEDLQEQILDLISFQQYKFDNFDLEVTKKLNLYFSSMFDRNEGIGNLNVVRLQEDGKGYYMEGGSTTRTVIASWKISKENIDPLLFESQVYARFPVFAAEEQNQPFSFELDGEKPFTSTKLKTVRTIDLGSALDDVFSTIFDTEKVRITKEYTEFLINFYINKLKVVNTKFEWNQNDADTAFKNAVDRFVTQLVGIRVGEDAILSAPLTYVPFQESIVIKLLNQYRLSFFKNLAKKANEIDLTGKYNPSINDDLLGKAEKAAADLDIVQDDPDAVDEGLSDEDIEARQKFLKQCMLMTRLDEIAAENLQNIAKAVKSNPTSVHPKNKPYGNRFYMVQDDPNGDQSAMINKLIIPAGDSIREFLDIKPSTHAYLIPKLRFYKVYTDKEGKLQEFRFHFRNFTDPSRVDKLSNPGVFDRGGDYGVKSFDFSFQGATPATAKNDIKANLSLYFQTFNDFIDRKKFKSPDGEDHAFVDLLLLPSGKPKDGSGAPSVFQFNPKYYRIRVDVGWEIESTKIKDLQEAIGVPAAANLSQSLEKINKSFYLNMIDHTMDFRDDGSVQIDVEYRAYIESALKGTSLDALASRKSREALKIVREDYIKILSKNRCTTEELNNIRLQLEQLEDLFKKQAYQSIMRRLIDNNTIYFKKAKDSSTQGFIKRGILTTKITFENMTGGSAPGGLPEASGPGDFTSSESGFKDLKLNDDYLYINYFYLGDLLYAISDALYEQDGKYIEGFERFKFVLGSFQYEDLLDNSGGPKTINLANIPISCELFYEWFTQNVIKPERNSYPIMYFIRDLCKFLIIEIMSETCFKRSFNKSLQFKTMNFLGKAKNNKDPLSQLYPSFSRLDLETIPDQLVLNLATRYGQTNSPLPLAVDDEAGVSITDLYNYVTIYVETPRLKSEKDTTTTRQQDEAMGVMHYQIGRDRGILKKIKFTKSDMQYIREARFFRHGTDGLMQLSAVYKVSMEMIGNTLYYPGMEIFIDPLGLFGVDEQADPRQKNSIANRLGFGGYHLITNVRSSIGPGKFTTTVDALFSYSGDGDPSSILLGAKDQVKKSEANLIDAAPDDRSQSSKDYCETVYNKVINQAIMINKGQDHYKPIDESALEEIFAGSVAVEADREERAEAYTESVSGGTTGVTDEVRDILIDAGALGNNSTETPLETLQRQAEEDDE